MCQELLVDKQVGYCYQVQIIEVVQIGLIVYDDQNEYYYGLQDGDDGLICFVEQDGCGFDVDFQIVVVIDYGIEGVVGYGLEYIGGKEQLCYLVDVVGFGCSGYGDGSGESGVQKQLG